MMADLNKFMEITGPFINKELQCIALFNRFFLSTFSVKYRQNVHSTIISSFWLDLTVPDFPSKLFSNQIHCILGFHSKMAKLSALCTVFSYIFVHVKNPINIAMYCIILQVPKIIDVIEYRYRKIYMLERDPKPCSHPIEALI